ncbi:MAG: hypothetical protein AAF385_12520, partial [Pseudomonadota bacterium]
MNSLIMALLALGLGLGLIHFTWRGQPVRRVLLLSAGWLLLLLSVYFWASRFGSEFGLVYAFCWISLVAWLFVGAETRFKPKNERNQQRSKSILTLGAGAMTWLDAISMRLMANRGIWVLCT